MYGEFDRAVIELGFSDPVPLLAGFDAGFLDGVSLEELVQPRLLAPETAVVVVLDLATFEVADDGIIPVRKLDAQARCRRIEQPACFVFGRGKLEANAGGPNSLLVPDFSFDLDNVAHKGCFLS